MPANVVTPFGRVPLIGVEKPKAVIHKVSASVVISCDCGSAVPVVVPGLDRAGLCAACKTKWVIAKIAYGMDAQGNVTMETAIGKWSGPMSASPDMDVVPPDTGKPAS